MDWLQRIHLPLFNTTARVAGMCCFPCFPPLRMATLLILFYCKTPLCLKCFFPVFVDLDHFPPPLPGPEWPATCPKSCCINVLCFLFSLQRLTTSWRWMFSRLEAASAQIFPASGLAIPMPDRAPPAPRSVSAEVSLLDVQYPYLVLGEPETGASPSLIPRACTPDNPLRAPIDQAPLTWPSPTRIFLPPFIHGMH